MMTGLIMAEGPSCDLETREEHIAGWHYFPRFDPDKLVQMLRTAREVLYVLDENHNVIPEPDREKWAQIQETADQHVKDEYVDGYRVSTIFMGKNMRIFPFGSVALVFETIAFDPKGDIVDQDRYCTWDEAAKGHDAIASRIRKVVSN